MRTVRVVGPRYRGQHLDAEKVAVVLVTRHEFFRGWIRWPGQVWTHGVSPTDMVDEPVTFRPKHRRRSQVPATRFTRDDKLRDAQVARVLDRPPKRGTTVVQASREREWTELSCA